MSWSSNVVSWHSQKGLHYLMRLIIKAMEERDEYKYLGVLEADNMLKDKMKDKIRKDYLATS